jgi:hypothetical protein
MRIGDDIRDLKQWDVRLHRDAVTRTEAGPQGADLIAIGAPNSAPGDEQIIHNWWSE